MNATLPLPDTRAWGRSASGFAPENPRGPKAIASLLPRRSDPDYLWILTELVRSDLEFQRSNGLAPTLDEYRADYPELFAQPAVARALEAIAAGLDTTASLSQTPRPSASLELTRVVAIAPLTVAPSSGRFPEVGDEVCGFRLTGELGRGAFARVFLAEQIGLADRPVALKVTVRPTREPQRLAKLRHTNIVPIYSVHDAPPLQAVCMPFLGRQTLADFVKEYRETGTFSVAGSHAASTALVAAHTTVVNPSVPAPVGTPGSGSHFRPVAARPERSALAQFSHPDLVLWVAARLTDGLAHAHDRGILHLDLKPANVLFADDGQPLLLDFNLSFDLAAGDRERAGGTLPYMAPEQLEEYRDGGPTAVDARTDLFALGAMIYELLTGYHPFPIPAGVRRSLTDMVDLRRAGAPSPRRWNRAVSPALDDVVRKLLQYDPANRYQSAQDLATDLRRHAENLPLKFAANRSLGERAAKWRRRHPRLLIRSLLAAAVVAGGGSATAAYYANAARAEGVAVEKTKSVKADLARLRVDLAVREDAQARAAALQHGRDRLAEYGLPERTDWRTAPDARRLPPTEQNALGDDLGELARLLAHAETLNATRIGGDRTATEERAKVWTTVAAACSGDRANLPAEQYLEAMRLMAEGKYLAASLVLERLTTKDPGHFAGQFQLATCRALLGDAPRALERYQIARGLAPDDPRSSYNRGMLLLVQGQAAEAIVELNDAIERDPTHAESYQHRAIARQTTDPRAALDDLTAALDRGASPTLVLPVRAVIYDRLGDKVAANRDFAAAAKLTPATPAEYIARGLARQRRKDPAGALADFVAASALNPNYLNAWQNQACVLADSLDQPVKALEAQNEAVRCAPDFASARVGRAVLFARLGQRTDAHQDAQRAMLLSADPKVTYQAACVYALTSTAHPTDKAIAIDLIRKALRDGYRRFDVVETDIDIDAIRNDPMFRSAFAAARELVK